jgi:hypothetical protein
MDLGLKTHPLCRIIWHWVRGALYLYQSSRWPPYLDSKKKEPRYAFKKYPSKSPVRVPPLHVPPTGSRWREMLRLQSQWFIHSFISVRVPKKELSHEMRGEHLVTVHRARTQTEGLYIVGCGLFPRGTEMSKPVCVCRTQLALVKQSRYRPGVAQRVPGS